MKLAVVIGHNSRAQGAVRGDTGETEYVWNGRLAQLMERDAAEFGIEMRVFRRTAGGGYRTEIRRVYDEVDRWGADASMELHFNGAASPAATGIETLSSGTALSLRFATAVQDEMIVALGLRDRGVKTVGGNERGGASLISGAAPAILVEPFFGSSLKGQEATDELHEQEALARAYLRGAARAFESYPRRDLSGSRTLDAAGKQRRAAQQGTVALSGSVVAEVTEAVLGPVDNLQGAASALQPVAQYLPWASGALALIGIGLFVYSRWQTERIESAREEDHEREIR